MENFNLSQNNDFVFRNWLKNEAELAKTKASPFELKKILHCFSPFSPIWELRYNFPLRPNWILERQSFDFAP